MVGRKKAYFWALLLLSAGILFSIPTMAEISLVPGDNGGEATWYYCEEWPGETCTTCAAVSCDTPYGDHWSVELATYFSGDDAVADTNYDGDSAYMRIYARREVPFTLGEVTNAGFTYMNLDDADAADDSSPSLAFALHDDATGEDYLLISDQLGPALTCTPIVAADFGFWFLGTWNGYDLDTFEYVQDYASFADTLTNITNYPVPAVINPSDDEVEAVLVVVGISTVSGEFVFGDPTALSTAVRMAPGNTQVVVDDVLLLWDTGSYGGTYNLEYPWDGDLSTVPPALEPIGFEDSSTEAGLEDQPPLESAKWCVENCNHCLDVDDENFWGVIPESDLAGLGIPAGADDFPAAGYDPDIGGAVDPVGESTYALYFGNTGSGTYEATSGQAAVGSICSPLNYLNPADEYLSLRFDYFREVEDYMAEYDWTYVQIQFLDESNNPVAGWDYTGAPGTWHNPFAYTSGGDWAGRNPGDLHPDGAGHDPDEISGDCPADLLAWGWKTVWYKDSRDSESNGKWAEAEITHYLDDDNEPDIDDDHLIRIPPKATKVRIRFSFNSVDGANNDYLGWVIDNIEKIHGPAPTGCTIVTDYLPQAVPNEKYDEDLDPQVDPSKESGPRSWSIDFVRKDGVDQRGKLPDRLSLDNVGRIYGYPEESAVGTYEIGLKIVCWDGSRDQVTLTLNIRSQITNSSSLWRYEDFDGANVALAIPFIFESLIPLNADCDSDAGNLWHQTSDVTGALEPAPAATGSEYGNVGFFGINDETDDPDYICDRGRVKGCLESEFMAVPPQYDGEELIIGFKSWRQVEHYPGQEYDRAWVDYRYEGGSWQGWEQTAWKRSSDTVSPATWIWHDVSTGLILHQGVKVQIRFCFDSIDAYANGVDNQTYGWLIDEISLYAGSPVLAITSCPPEEASVDDYFIYELTASGGSNFNPTWELDEDYGQGLPPGLGLIETTDNSGRKAFIRGTPREAGLFTFKIRVRNDDWTEVATRICTINVGRDVTIFYEDFESDPAWSLSGLWRFTGSDAGATPDPVTQVNDINEGISTGDLGEDNHAAYFGRTAVADYSTGSRATGMLTVMDIDTSAAGIQLIPVSGISAVEISFDYWRSVEPYPGGAYDVVSVQVMTDVSPWTTIWLLTSADQSTEEWLNTGSGDLRTKPVPVFSLPDGASQMAIRFVFDSLDKWYNNYVGWVIDNVRVQSTTDTGAAPLSALSLRPNANDPRGVPAELQVMNLPNPVTDVHTTTFMVRSTAVEAMRIVIYDASGALVFEEEIPGNELVWHTENDYGEYLSNGIYFYHAYVLMDGQWIETGFQKLVILR